MENNNNNNPFSEEAMLAPADSTDFERAAAEALAFAEPEVAVAETPVEPVVEAPVYQAPEEVQALGSVSDGVIGATTAPKAPEKIKTPKARKEEETVAINSTRNVSWPEVGKVYVGINIVPKSVADKWLTRSHVSPATPEEVAKEFGK
jgi:hypothetical protein